MDGSIVDGDVSLRDALVAANVGETIVFDPALDGQTINLVLGELPVTRAIRIEGPGSHHLTIDAGANSRVFLFDDGDSGTQVGVELSGLTLTRGNASNAASFTGRGGAIYTRESLAVRDVAITDSMATDVGGAIAALAPLSISESTLSHNSAAGGGGGIWVGGINTTIRDTTIVDNSAGVGGGMLVSVDAITEIINSTISQNSATDGGGVYVLVGDLVVRHATITANSASSRGGGIFTTHHISHLELDHSLAAGNEASSSPDINHASPLFTNTTSFSLVGNNQGTLLQEAPLGSPDVNGNLVGDPVGSGVIDPLLQPLAANGGRTVTHALMPGSPAIDAGDPHATAGVGDTPQFDQRGTPFARVNDGDGDEVPRIDLGAYERAALLTCDFDGDDDCDVDDIDALVAAIAKGNHDVSFDLTGDGSVDLHDRDRWLHDAGALNLGKGRTYRLGDANLDGVVDGLDFLHWNTHKFTHTAAWSAGDFNADGAVDGSDFVIWTMNKFHVNDVGMSNPLQAVGAQTWLQRP